MDLFNNSLKEKKLLQILGSFDLKELSTKEINYFKNKKILITGVSGIIGLNLLFFFNTIVEKKKISLKIDGTFNISLFDFVKKYFRKKKYIKFKKIDLSKSKITSHKSYDLIFHCAGYGQPAKFLKFSSSTYKLNSIAIMNLSRNLKKNGKFIFMSTTEIYSGNNRLCNEKSFGYTTPSHPRSAYIDSKKFGESYLTNNDRNFLIFRICLTYGPGAKLSDERILNLLLLRSIKNKQIDIYGGMGQVRSNLFIDDAINLIIKSTSRSNKEVCNVSNALGLHD